MASSSPGGSGLLRGTRTRSYGSLVQSPYSPARIRKVEHLVQPGDTLQGLALRYGVTTEQIKRANRLYTNESIFLKKFLSIPVLTEQPELANGGGFKEEDSGTGESGAGESTEGSVKAEPEREPKSRSHRSSTQAEQRSELSASDFMNKLDTRIRVSKRAAVKKIQEGERRDGEEEAAPAAGYQSPCLSSSCEGSPQTQQRSLLGRVPLTMTTRASTIRDHEDEIFKL